MCASICSQVSLIVLFTAPTSVKLVTLQSPGSHPRSQAHGAQKSAFLHVFQLRLTLELLKTSDQYAIGFKILNWWFFFFFWRQSQRCRLCCYLLAGEQCLTYNSPFSQHPAAGRSGSHSHSPKQRSSPAWEGAQIARSAPQVYLYC